MKINSLSSISESEYQETLNFLKKKGKSGLNIV